MEPNNTNNNAPCKCGGKKMFSILVVLFGLTFLLQTLGVLTPYGVGIIWPILVIIAGVTKMCRCGCHHKC
jgi:hypothetical protein